MPPLPAAELVNLVTNAANAYFTGTVNRKSRKWNEKMYDKQRADAIADWHMNNEYNSPAEQMKRLKAGGLNPNLVYDNGASAGSPSPVRSSSVESWKPDAPQLDAQGITQSLMQQYDVALKQAQTDNIKAATEVAKQDTALKMAQTASTVTGNSQSKFNLKMAENLEAVSLESASVGLNKQKADLSYTLDNNERQAAMTAQTLQKGVEEILKVRAERSQTAAQTQKINAEIQNLRKDGTLKELDINLRKMGIMPGDPAYMRILTQLVNGKTSVIQSGKNMLNNLTNSKLGDDLFNVLDATPGGWQNKK